ncbi:MAG TPA: NlpC/P60 family protein [Micromonosporaceae bacterium]
MPRKRHNVRRGQNGTISPVLRPLAWSALVTAAAAVAFANPAYADPSLPDTIPDAGARPVPVGQFRLPGQGAIPGASNVPAPSLVNGPLATAAYAKEVEVATLGDQLLQLRQQRDTALDSRAAAESRLQAARDSLASARAAAEAVAAAALKDAAALPPGEFGSDLQGLSMLSRIGKGETNGPNTTTTARDLARAKAAEQAAGVELQAAEALVSRFDVQFADLEAKHQRAEAGLLKLRQDHAAQLAVIERAQEALEQRLGANYVGRGSLSGMAAHPKALAAVRYALAQVGDQYLWAAEGPDRFDCSGLMWAAYRSVGFELPRVSRDQYFATRGRSVSRYDLLPGDLIFFASGSNWTTIHHVGMYVGDGKMVHAPGTGDMVKISTVSWSRFYAATRIFGEVPAPAAPGAPVIPVPPFVTSPPPGTSTQSPGPIATPGPTGTASPSPTGTASPSPTGTASPNPTGTASPSPTGTASPSPTGTATPAPTSTSVEPSPTPTSSSPQPVESSVAPSTASSTEPSTSPTATASSSASSTGA